MSVSVNNFNFILCYLLPFSLDLSKRKWNQSIIILFRPSAFTVSFNIITYSSLSIPSSIRYSGHSKDVSLIWSNEKKTKEKRYFLWLLKWFWLRSMIIHPLSHFFNFFFFFGSPRLRNESTAECCCKILA